ncbi:MAG: extracellular solute-binding protein [Clostridia bacterium]|nr:extracellular solute-binding protein [Clostridia bacterium]
MKKLVSLLLIAVLALGMCAAASAELLGPGNVTLKRLSYTCPWDPNNDYMVPIMKEATGYDVDFYALPSNDADNKLMLEVGGGADYDIVTVNINQWRMLLAAGALMPITDLLNTYGQDILAGNTDEVWATLTQDGDIYGMPYMYPHSQEITSFLVCRKDLLNAAGITELPKTISGFYDMLVALKNFYGDQYIILTGPLVAASEGNDSWRIPKCITSAFGIYSDWMVEDGKVIYASESPKFVEMMNFFNKLYTEGLIDVDWAVNSESAVQEKFVSGKAIICCGSRALVNFTTAAMIDQLHISMDDLCYINPLYGDDGVCTYQESEAINQVSCVLRNAKHPEDAINWINTKVQNQLFINIGVEGVHFTYDEVGQISPINPIFANERGDSYYYIDATNAADYQFQWPSRIRKSAGQWHAFNATTITNPDLSIFVKNYFKFMPASEAYATNNTALYSSLQDLILQMMAGVKTEADLATFANDFANNDGEEVRAELQAYYDSLAK